MSQLLKKCLTFSDVRVPLGRAQSFCYSLLSRSCRTWVRRQTRDKHQMIENWIERLVICYSKRKIYSIETVKSQTGDVELERIIPETLRSGERLPLGWCLMNMNVCGKSHCNSSNSFSNTELKTINVNLNLVWSQVNSLPGIPWCLSQSIHQMLR